MIKAEASLVPESYKFPWSAACGSEYHQRSLSIQHLPIMDEVPAYAYLSKTLLGRYRCSLSSFRHRRKKKRKRSVQMARAQTDLLKPQKSP